MILTKVNPHFRSTPWEECNEFLHHDVGEGEFRERQTGYERTIEVFLCHSVESGFVHFVALVVHLTGNGCECAGFDELSCKFHISCDSLFPSFEGVGFATIFEFDFGIVEEQFRIGGEHVGRIVGIEPASLAVFRVGDSFGATPEVFCSTDRTGSTGET